MANEIPEIVNNAVERVAGKRAPHGGVEPVGKPLKRAFLVSLEQRHNFTGSNKNGNDDNSECD